MSKMIAGLVGLVLLIGGLVYWGLASDTKTVTTSDPGPVLDTDWVKGDASAPVTLLEYTDFQCPACGAYHPVLKQATDGYKGKLRLVIRHFPLIQLHKNALSAARAAEAAGRQGKFWEMYDMLFPNQREWSELGNPLDQFAKYADKIGLNVDQFKKDYADSSIDTNINRGLDSGKALDVAGTPTFYLNGKAIQNPPSYEALKVLIEAELAKQPNTPAVPTPSGQ